MKQMKELTIREKKEESVDYIKKKKKAFDTSENRRGPVERQDFHRSSSSYDNTRSKKFYTGRSKTDLRRCMNCGYKHAVETYCPATRRRCNQCNKYGHFQTMCSRFRENQIDDDEDYYPDDNYEDENEEFFIGMIGSTDKQTPEDDWHIELALNRKESI
ncbi:hypothetical protein SNE40_018269 [Patella caerulea]|uniref:CCHC-type domain-containing protein n=1 Tax=Patella caerulea TaxID=87958 RepID=A0AAN8JC70_PATCE